MNELQFVFKCVAVPLWIFKYLGGRDRSRTVPNTQRERRNLEGFFTNCSCPLGEESDIQLPTGLKQGLSIFWWE